MKTEVKKTSNAMAQLLKVSRAGDFMNPRSNLVRFKTKKSISLLIVSALFGSTALAGKLLPDNVKPQTSAQESKLSQSEIEDLKKNSINLRKQGDSIRFRFLPDKDVSSSILELKKRTTPVFESQKSTVMGPGSTGGGFTNYRGAMKSLKIELAGMIEKLEKTSDWYFQKQMPSNLRSKFQRGKLIAALRNVRYSYFQSGLAVAPDGAPDELLADYEINNSDNYIILLKSFFETFNGVNSVQEKVARIRTILHEVTHLFGIGLANDEESYIASLYLTRLMVDHPIYCGVSSQDFKQAAEDCSKFISTRYEDLNPTNESLQKWQEAQDLAKSESRRIHNTVRIFDLRFVTYEKSVLEDFLPHYWNRKQADDFLNGDLFINVDRTSAQSNGSFIPEKVHAIFLANDQFETNVISINTHTSTSFLVSADAHGRPYGVKVDDLSDSALRSVLDQECSLLGQFDLVGGPKRWKAEIIQKLDTYGTGDDYYNLKFVCTAKR